MRLFTIDICSKIVNLGAMTWPHYTENHIYSEAQYNEVKLYSISWPFYDHFMSNLHFFFIGAATVVSVATDC